MPRIEKAALVFVVLTIIVVVILVLFTDWSPNRSRTTGDRVTKVAVGSRVFWIRYARWPTNMEQMVRLGILTPADTNDAWGHPLLYAPYEFSLKRGTVTSYGADGKPGGVAEASDTQATFW